MNPFPETISKSALWNKISLHPEFSQAVKDIRQTAAALGAQIGRVMPNYTDHSIVHMDALWSVADHVFTTEELSNFSGGEAFILGASFYVHDLGMALGATPEGAAELRRTTSYKAAYERSHRRFGDMAEAVDQFSLEIAARDIHASKALDLVQKPLPGLQRYLIESTVLREHWAHFIGEISASHHWSLQEVDSKLGARGRVPDANGGNLDLGFVACALRLIDYAHINLNRASSLDQLLRSSIDSSSIVHWKAQQLITGPSRQENLLVFGSIQPVQSVDAWWLFYEMASGLNIEIHNVSEYLDGRKISSNRFSLEGVKGIQSPHNFSTFVEPGGFEPVDVRFRPDSIERLIELLGGPTLYGNDLFAPIRELLQNARDATALKLASEQREALPPGTRTITVSIKKCEQDYCLSVSDSGVGMTPDIVTTYLLGIASDYWNSSHFASQYPGVSQSGFRPTGRFGIGFLSAFMIGDNVEVKTQRYGGPCTNLTLHGLGRRGALVTSEALPESGTRITVKITKHDPAVYDHLESVVRARAPMLDVPIRVEHADQAVIINPGWWQTIEQEGFHDFVTKWEMTAKSSSKKTRNKSTGKTHHYDANVFQRFTPLRDLSHFEKWPKLQPEIVHSDCRVIAIPTRGSLLVCSRGIGVTTFASEGITGIIQLDEIKLDAARSTPVGLDMDKTKKELLQGLRPKIVAAVDALAEEAMVPARFEFLASVAGAYGTDILTSTKLPWLTVMQPPGNGVLLSPAQFQDKVKQVGEILIAYDTGPWTVVDHCYSVFPSASKEALLIPVSAKGQSSADSYLDEDRTLGALPNHFDEEGDLADAYLLNTTLCLIADAWNIPVETLISHKWHCNKDGTLVSRFIRKRLAKKLD